MQYCRVHAVSGNARGRCGWLCTLFLRLCRLCCSKCAAPLIQCSASEHSKPQVSERGGDRIA